MSVPGYLVSQVIGGSKITALNPPASAANLPDGQLVYFKGVGYKYAENGVYVAVGGGGGSSAGPANTPGFGAATVNAGTLGSTLNDWNTGATWGVTTPTSTIRATAAVGNTQVYGIVSTGAVEGQTVDIYNPSATDSIVLNNDSTNCPTPADRIFLTASTSVIPPRGHGLMRYNAADSRWTRMS